MELFKAMAQIDIVHVPYKSQAAALSDIVQGAASIGLSGTPAALALSKGGQLKILAVTSLERSKYLPQMPTMAESGLPGYDVNGWFGLLGPVSTAAAGV